MSQGSRPVCLILSLEPAFHAAVTGAAATLDVRMQHAYDAADAMATLTVWPVRCVIVDLAAGDGWQLVVAKLRGKPEIAAAPVLFIADSAKAVDDLLALAPEGHWDLMRTPLHPRWLAAKVGHLICTELRVARSAAQSESQMAMIDALPAQVCVVDAEGRVTMGNRAWRLYEGVVAEPAAVGWNYRDLCARAAAVGAAHLSEVCSGLDQVLSGERLRFECEYSVDVSAGGRRHFQVSIVRLGGEGGAVICRFDTTHQKRAEAERLETMRHLELVMDAVELNLFEYDLGSGRRVVGTRDYELFGQQPESLADMRERFVHPEDRERFAAVLDQAIQGQEHGTIEYRVAIGPTPRWRCAVARVIDRSLGNPGRLVGASWDITARKLAQIESERLSISRSMALDAGHFNAWEWDFVLGRGSGGERDVELFGCEIESGEQLVALTHPDDRERVRALWGADAIPVDEFDVEFRVLRDSDVRWIQAVGRLERDAQGQPRRQVGLSWDITEHKRAEIALRESEAQLRGALEAARMVSWEWDLESGERRSIGNDLAVLGESPVTIHTAKTRVHPEDLERHLADIDRAISGGEPYQSEFRVIWPDGSEHWLLSRGTPTRGADGRVVRLSGLVWDISARKQVEDALIESRRLQELAIEGAGLNIWEFDLQTGVRRGGPRDAAFYGFSPQDHEAFKQLLSPEDAAALDAAMQRALTAAGHYEVEYGVTTPTGEKRWFSALGQLVRDRAGQPDKLVGVTYDVSARHRQEQAMAAALATAEQASRAKSSFLAATSHELRTPMNAVLGMTRLLVDTDLDARQRELLETIRSSGDLLLRLINDVLDFSRIEAGEMPIDATDFDTLACIESSIEIVAQQAEAKGLDLFLDIAPEACRRVRGDPTRLRQILVNVLVNAIKFTDRGEVRLTVQMQPLDAGRVELEFQIADTGIGMSEDLIGQVFLPFRQGDGSMTRRHGGTGLGLAICRRLAELMQGRITAVSLAGQGSRFEIRLPFDDLGGALPEIRNLQVMVASPHRSSRDAAVTQLRRFGVSVMSCNGSDPLPESILVEQELLLLDDQLFADYPELIDEILTRHQRHPAIARIVSLRDNIRRELPDWVRDLGTITRPIRPSVLLALLNDLDEALRRQHQEFATPTIAKLADRYPLSILVAEDNLINQMLLQMMLEALGYGCDIVNHGREVLSAIEHKHYDLILMDVEMPEMDGIEASRALRVRFGQQDSPQIIAVTAHVLAGSRERFLAAGMNDFVAKPVIIDELCTALIRAHEAKLRYQRTAMV
ncbi:MAG: PAS domain-containing protein [Xanthomonadales bacterium]|nr:PAS domain-containing protein [Xanthomonadales bacterium]